MGISSYDFEKGAKNLVIQMLAKRGIDAKIEELQLVWFSHLLGNKKCMIWGECMGDLYAEVTYAWDSQMAYVDLYKKLDHADVPEWEINFDAHTDKC